MSPTALDQRQSNSTIEVKVGWEPRLFSTQLTYFRHVPCWSNYS